MQNEGSIFENTIKRNKRIYRYYCFQWVDEKGKKHKKYFSHTKVGKKEAVKFQKEIMEKRNKGFQLLDAVDYWNAHRRTSCTSMV